MAQLGIGQNKSEKIPVSRIVAIGASAGGIHSLREFLPQLPLIPDCCVLIVVHLAPLQRSFLPQILGRNANWTVKQAEDGETICAGVVYIAPPICTLYYLVTDCSCLLRRMSVCSVLRWTCCSNRSLKNEALQRLASCYRAPVATVPMACVR